jgi:hypothetical protein
MLNKVYKLMASGVCASLLLATLAVAPVAAQTQPGGNTGSTPSANLSAPQDAAFQNTQNPCVELSQGQTTTSGATQGTDAVSTQSAGQKPQASTADQGQQGAANVGDATMTTAQDANVNQAGNAAANTAQFPCPGTNRETAGPPFPAPVQLFPGTAHWYRFRYQAIPNDESDEDANVVVTMKLERPGCATFDVTTSGRLNFPFDSEGDPIGPVGQGTPFRTGDDDADTDPSTLIWVGSSDFSETYFVIVRPRSNSQCTYTLKIDGAPVVY